MNNENKQWKRKFGPPLPPILGVFKFRYPHKNLGRNAPIPEDTF